MKLKPSSMQCYMYIALLVFGCKTPNKDSPPEENRAAQIENGSEKGKLQITTPVVPDEGCKSCSKIPPPLPATTPILMLSGAPDDDVEVSKDLDCAKSCIAPDDPCPDIEGLPDFECKKTDKYKRHLQLLLLQRDCIRRNCNGFYAYCVECGLGFGDEVNYTLPGTTAKVMCDGCSRRHEDGTDPTATEILECITAELHGWFEKWHPNDDPAPVCRHYAGLAMEVLNACHEAYGITSSCLQVSVASGALDAHMWLKVMIHGKCYMWDPYNDILVETACPGPGGF